MRFHPRLIGPAASLFLSLLASCCSPFGTGRQDQTLTILSWNVLSLFDAVEDGSEYPDFSLEGGTWDEARYRTRLELTGKAILTSKEAAVGGPPGPDLVCLVEVEKEAVLADLASGPLAPGKYRYRAFAKVPGSPIGLGVLSRLPIAESRAWGLSFGEAQERPILEVRLSDPAGGLFVFLCHWKSKLGGAEATEAQRRGSAALLARLIASREASYPGQAVLACGDFNENPDEHERVGRRYPTAFGRGAPGRPTGAVIALGDRATAEGGLFSPWSGSDAYSYVHRGERERIDGFILGAALMDGRSLDYSFFRAVDGAGLVDSEGRPRPWSSVSATGCSDHLPLLLGLSRLGGG